jgi:hypothetical protein
MGFTLVIPKVIDSALPVAAAPAVTAASSVVDRVAVAGTVAVEGGMVGVDPGVAGGAHNTLLLIEL